MSEVNEPYGLWEDDNEPEIWDEYQWEEFMKEADRRTEKYSQLLDKYMDHPDRDRIIAKEMGWDHMLDEMDEENDKSDWETDFFIDEDEEGEGWKQVTGFEPAEFDSFENLPVYQMAYEYSIDAIQLIQSRFENENDESAEDFTRSVILPAAKIAGGFGMGFDPETLGGNIANCKRGLNAANQALNALQEMRKKEILDEEIYLDFYSRGKEVRDELAIYIVELRDRFRRGI